MGEHKGSAGDLDLHQVAAMRTGLAPLYHSLGHVIRTKIQGGDWPPDAQIPSERALVEMLGVSRATVRQGIENLVREGILYRVQGKGTFVAKPKMTQGLRRLTHFSETMRRNGLTPQFRLIGKAQIVPPSHICQSLDLPAGEPVYWFQRLISLHAAPMLIETAYFPVERFAGLLELYDGSDDPHQFAFQQYALQAAREHEVFEPVILESEEATLLGVKSGYPALWVEHTAYDLAGRPLALLTSLLRGDRCRFYTDLSNG